RLPRIAVAAVAREERCREDVTSPGGIGLDGAARAHFVAIAVDVEQRAATARRDDGDRHALDPLGHRRLLAPYVRRTEKQRLQPPQRLRRGCPADGSHHTVAREAA